MDELYKLKGQLTTHIEIASDELKKVNAQIFAQLAELAKKQQEAYKGPTMVKNDESSQSVN